MWLRKISTLLLVTGLTLLPQIVTAKTLSGTTRWSGTVSLDEAMTVPRGATLIIAAGTTVVPKKADALISVSGKLQIEGTVITSYSIHYTKLYEISRRRFPQAVGCRYWPPARQPCH